MAAEEDDSSCIGCSGSRRFGRDPSKSVSRAYLQAYTPPVPQAGLDDEKLSMLARWAGGLRRDDRAEIAAAGRAIEMLIDEIERLNVLLWAGPLDAVPTTLERAAADEATIADERELPTTLAERLKYRRRSRV